jgi:CRISPR-associated endonuclease/helicase Cas3
MLAPRNKNRYSVSQLTKRVLVEKAFERFFEEITDFAPMPHQVNFHAASGRDHRILVVPTGLGKTLTVLVDWLYSVREGNGKCCRRLAWCLPGRALTEQTAEVIRKAVDRSKLPVKVVMLMGGSEDNDLTLRPDEYAVLVGTQDILLSRALNRGYARKSFRWPIDFALLNNDCYWVLDEVQLLGDGVATSTQLAAFRERFATFGDVGCTWMSATFQPEWLDTVDFAPLREFVTVTGIEGDDSEIARKRVCAPKALAFAPLGRSAAELVVERHQPGTLSLLIVNTVARAREAFGEIQKRSKADALLLHSRFRPGDRAAGVKRLSAELPPEGRIVVATQVIEAGIDVDASLLVTDIAPYASLVQRFGRVNRKGDRAASEIWIVDVAAGLPENSKEAKKACLPYECVEVVKAREHLARVSSAAPRDLPTVELPAPWNNVLRRADLLDLFDTTPDLAGNEIDISRFVREGDDKNVYVAWRDWTQVRAENPPEDMPEVRDEELCPVPIGEIKAFLKRRTAWKWVLVSERGKDGAWEEQDAERMYPGLVLAVHASAGGYTRDYGWTPDSKKKVEVVEVTAEGQESFGADRASQSGYRQTLRDHTDRVCARMEELLGALPAVGAFAETLRRAARKHDWGKAHRVMQQTLHKLEKLPDELPVAELLAKQKRADARRSHSVPFFRHELASALAMLEEGESDLAAFVVAAHHGRVRLGIRSMPGERDRGGEISRGIRSGDVLLACDLGEGESKAPVTLRLGYMKMGGDGESRSWTERMLRQLDELGPFRLAYLEMLLRAADELASKEEAPVCT